MRLLALAVLLVSGVAGQVQIVSQGPAVRAVALTFDAGADTGYAPLILHTLEVNHIHASFGMTGAWALANPALVRRMAHDGDQLINHTFDHRSFTGLSTHLAPLTLARRAWEIQRADAVVRRIVGRTTRPYFRPPFGDYDAATLVLLRRLGYTRMIMWTLDSLGWDGLSRAAILHRCLAGTRPGAIFLMHVGIQSQDGLALPALIAALRQQGYHFDTVAQLLGGR